MRKKEYHRFYKFTETKRGGGGEICTGFLEILAVGVTIKLKECLISFLNKNHKRRAKISY
jgi:hypothetical protein